MVVRNRALRSDRKGQQQPLATVAAAEASMDESTSAASSGDERDHSHGNGLLNSASSSLAAPIHSSSSSHPSAAPVSTSAANTTSTAAGAGNTSPGADTTLLVDRPDRWKNFMVRTTWTLLMVGGFLLILACGHLPTIVFVLIMQALMFREVVRINTHRVRRARASSSTSAASAAAAAAQSSKSFGGDRSLRFFNYYLLLTTIYFMYGKLLYARIPQAHPLKDAHTFVSFMMLMGGFVGFVLSLRKNDLKMQFRQFGLTVLSLFFVVVLASTIVHNIMEGMFWFVFPAALIVVNDISAYLFGFFFGRTPLIALSPKKTWEGFLGATFTTIAVAYLAAPFVAAWFPSFQCRHVDLFSNECATTLSPAFDSKEVLQKHALVLGAFAATIAPFGGFFASGFKRAFGVKDFGDTIPGHGGITDRMDCQTLMGVFVYVYYSTFLQVRAPVSAEKLFDQAMHLSLEQQRMLYSMLGSVLG